MDEGYDVITVATAHSVRYTCAMHVEKERDLS